MSEYKVKRHLKTCLRKYTEESFLPQGAEHWAKVTSITLSTRIFAIVFLPSLLEYQIPVPSPQKSHLPPQRKEKYKQNDKTL